MNPQQPTYIILEETKDQTKKFLTAKSRHKIYSNVYLCLIPITYVLSFFLFIDVQPARQNVNISLTINHTKRSLSQSVCY